MHRWINFHNCWINNAVFYLILYILKSVSSFTRSFAKGLIQIPCSLLVKDETDFKIQGMRFNTALLIQQLWKAEVHETETERQRQREVER